MERGVSGFSNGRRAGGREESGGPTQMEDAAESQIFPQLSEGLGSRHRVDHATGFPKMPG